MPDSKPKPKLTTLDEIRCAVQAIEDKKGEHVRVLDVRGKSTITDYLVLATGTSDPHLKALKGELDRVLKEQGVQLVGEDRTVTSGWVVVDAFDFMVHLQTAEMRDFYRLDQLWKDASEIEL
ncbi:ribosome silencing factor [Coraliomargarita parva]|uniref:ribosome silencing factor n=1 Tax=Coraliomargarita parva TaxID=3014050 RepID=UPI0022B5D455|nr:ribosome silencing factor [Coraliomargarita parva]